jgi:CRISPR-associated protein Cmr6
MPLPLPKPDRDVFANADESANVGLLFDRAPDHWHASFDGASEKTIFLDKVRQQAEKRSARALLRDLLERRSRLIQTLAGREVTINTTWRLVSGLGMSHVLENGFVWDRNLGVPYLPGSSVKGVMRAWTEQWDTEHWGQYKALFGDTNELGAGQIIVHDAFPTQVPLLELDVMSIHASTYYRDPRQVPADDEDPIVVTFLAVKANTMFTFGLSPRLGVQPAPDLDAAENLLRTALKTLGIGSKTAVGYGHFMAQ